MGKANTSLNLNSAAAQATKVSICTEKFPGQMNSLQLKFIKQTRKVGTMVRTTEGADSRNQPAKLVYVLEQSGMTYKTLSFNIFR